jgi:hypothetical protein
VKSLGFSLKCREDDEKKMIDDVVKGMKEFKKEKFLEEFNGKEGRG